MADSPSDPVYIHPDTPAPQEADFGFSPYIVTIADLIAYRENKTPMVVGIYGKWGSGKTSLMRYVETRLKDKKKNGRFRVCKPVWFQAWKYKDEDEILAALLEQIFNTMSRDGFFNKLKAQTEAAAAGKKFGKTVATLVQKVFSMDVSQFFQGLSYREKLGFYDDFEEFFKRLIWTYLSNRPQYYVDESYDDKDGVLVIFIDDLDRCPEPRIVGVLETIKLLVDIPGCVFVIGADNEIIFKALEKDYGDQAERFMDKIVQVTFNLPRIPDDAFNPYLDKILKVAGQEDDPHLKEYLSELLPVLDNNPRNFKRFLNDLNLQKGLITNKGLKLEPKHLLLWNLIEKGFRSCYLAFKEEGGYRVLEAVHDVIDQANEKKIDFEAIGKDGNDIKIPDSVALFVTDRRLREILDQFRPDDENLDLKKWLAQFVSLSQVVEGPSQKKKEVVQKGRTLENGKWVLIKAGSFLSGDGKEEKTIEYDYEMELYPLTNKQFELFIQAGGYREKKFWSDEGWQVREERNWDEPEHWNNGKYNHAEQPVVGVSYYEIEAYTKWLRAFKKDVYTYRLPTEDEWERAARGDRGNIYPWGDKFNMERCNSKESGLWKPSRVSLYPNGVSPFGCYDMAGNVWEWTSSCHSKEEDSYILRGGAFNTPGKYCRCVARGAVNRGGRDEAVGFRCARIKL